MGDDALAGIDDDDVGGIGRAGFPHEAMGRVDQDGVVAVELFGPGACGGFGDIDDAEDRRMAGVGVMDEVEEGLSFLGAGAAVLDEGKYDGSVLEEFGEAVGFAIMSFHGEIAEGLPHHVATCGGHGG